MISIVNIANIGTVKADIPNLTSARLLLLLAGRVKGHLLDCRVELVHLMTMSGPANLQMAKFARQMTDSRATPIHCAARPPQRAFTLRAGPPSSRTAQGSFDQALSTLKQACETKSVSIEDVKSALAAAEAEGPAVEGMSAIVTSGGY